jgi:hypothetical protein
VQRSAGGNVDGGVEQIAKDLWAEIAWLEAAAEVVDGQEDVERCVADGLR